MPSYFITGASRGLGFEFLQQLSSNSENIVIGLARNKAATDKKIASQFPGRENVFIVEGDVTDLEGLERAAKETEKITGGGLDYVIANAAVSSKGGKTLGQLDLVTLKEDLINCFNVNVVGVAATFNAFLPLIKKGQTKKVITISTGLADLDVINDFEIDVHGPYSISKAATNATVAKYNAEFKQEGILFMGISPGVVDTGNYANLTPEEAAVGARLMKKLMEYKPDFAGPITPEESVKKVMNVIWNSSIEKGSGGAFVSHFGNKTWI
ncbi:MAG: hypothetical protein M1834_000508 [Cirrosporium novae-zelandiae]|nr:MAG: hypothetical protein M1834_000508 [Cirrosporium novae-zelandiae]